MEYPIDLSMTTASEVLELPNGKAVRVGKMKLRFIGWHGSKEFLNTLPRTLSIKPLVSFRNSAVFAEIALVRMFEAAAWKAWWVDSFHRRYRADMPPAATSLPEPLAYIMKTVRERYRQVGDAGPERHARRGEFGGAWDVVCWNGWRALFVEAKLARKDRVRPSQIAWLQAALEIGVSADSFLIAEWEIE